MRHSKGHKIKKSLSSRKSKKNVCTRCFKNVITMGKAPPKLLISYKNICKSAKCIIHGKSPKTASTVKFKRKGKLIKKELDRRKSLKVNLFNAPCAVDEFEDVGNSFDDIDNEMFAKIEATVEDSDEPRDYRVESVLGFGLIKEIINRTIVWPLKKPEIFKGLRTAPKGILFFGPPGTGKTTLGKYIAFETNSTFLNISPSTLTSKWLGESEKLVRTMFVVAKARQPSVIFIDEVDSILSQRITDENGCIRRMKNEFLICMDAGDITSAEDRVLVIGATNKPQELDEAARRRFFKRFYVPLPDNFSRKEILLKLLEHECHSLEEIDINDIVRKTEGYSLADLKNLSHEAAMGPVKPLSRNAFVRLKPRDIRPISMEDFLCALQLIKPTVSREQIQSYEHWDTLYGYGGEENSKLRKAAASQENIKKMIHDPYIL